MSQARSTYRNDFGPHSWFENNINSDEFCSSNNIDDCLKYLSQEFSALGYPSIYAASSSCPCSVNCDIVQLLNVIFEILKDLKENADIKEELNSRNQCLSSDLTALNKRHTQLKKNLELTERKLNGSLEKERQYKVKNDQLQSLLKKEKEETKKLCAQLQQQKLSYQREIKRHENSLSQMKSKLNQVLSDKNPEKKIANISVSHLLQRNSNQRGKWRTESQAKSSADEMYNSVISTYENRSQMALKEIEEYKHCFQLIEHHLEKTISCVEGNSFQSTMPSLKAILNGPNSHEELRQKFGAMLTSIQNIMLNEVTINKNLSKEVNSLKADLLNIKTTGTTTNVDQRNQNLPLISSNLEKSTNEKALCLVKSKENLSEQKAELVRTLGQIKDEKANLEIQKLEFIKSAMKQKSSINSPHCSKSVPSFCVVTTKTNLTAVPDSHQLKHCLSCPDEILQSMTPLWKTNILKTEELLSPIGASPLSDSSYSSAFQSFFSPNSSKNDSPVSDLPKWARAAVSESDSLTSDSYLLPEESDLLQTESSFCAELKVTDVSCSEEDNLAKLKAAMDDIEKRRCNFFPK